MKNKIITLRDNHIILANMTEEMADEFQDYWEMIGYKEFNKYLQDGRVDDLWDDECKVLTIEEDEFDQLIFIGGLTGKQKIVFQNWWKQKGKYAFADDTNIRKGLYSFIFDEEEDKELHIEVDFSDPDDLEKRFQTADNAPKGLNEFLESHAAQQAD